MTLRTKPQIWRQSTLAQRLEDCRILLHIHGYLRDGESDRIKAKLAREWAQQEDQ